MRTMIIEGLGVILSSSGPHSCFANSRLLAALTPSSGCRVHAFTFFQDAKKFERLASLIFMQVVSEANQSRDHNLFVPNVLQTWFMRNVQPKLMNELDLFIAQVRRMGAEVEVLDLSARTNHAEADPLVRFVG